MKKLFIVLVSMFALSVLAAEPVQFADSQTTVKSVSKILSKKSKRQLKAILSVSAKTVLNDTDDYGPADSDDLDMHRAYARPKLISVTRDNFDISPDIAARLKLARQLAVNRHQEIWCGAREVQGN